MPDKHDDDRPKAETKAETKPRPRPVHERKADAIEPGTLVTAKDRDGVGRVLSLSEDGGTARVTWPRPRLESDEPVSELTIKPEPKARPEPRQEQGPDA